MTVQLPTPSAPAFDRPAAKLTRLARRVHWARRYLSTRFAGALGALLVGSVPMLATIGVASIAVGATAAAQNGGNAVGGAPRQDGPPPIQQDGDYYVVSFSEDEANGLTLLDFVKNCERATGLNFVVTKETVQLLKGQNVRMYGPKRIKQSEFYSFFQIVMFINDFACVEVGPPALRVIVIQSLAQGRGTPNGPGQKSTYVAPDNLEEWRDRPATLITTVVNLPNSDARALANSLRALAGTNPNQNMLPAGINSLILTGFGSSVYELAQLLYLIDESSAIEDPTPPVFDRIPLQFSAAADVQKIVEELLAASQQIQDEALRAAGEQQQNARPRQAVTAKILIEARTNSLVVMAMATDMPRIKDLIARLDTDVLEPERNYHIYQLENVAAVDMAETLESFLEDAKSVTALPGATGGQNRAPTASTSEDVVVVPEKISNSLIIAANKTRYAEVVELIRSLDRRQDQVLIETALVELSSNDFVDIGVELGLANLPNANGTGGFGVTSFGLSTLQDLDNDGVFDSRVPNQADGITAGIIDGNDFSLPFLLRLLRERTDANVLSVPSILVNNNGEAEITITDEIPFTQVTANGGVSGQTQTNFAGYEEAGISLKISPSISASRYLRLGIELEVSNFVGEQVGNVPPPRVTRTLKTTVNVPDGDTMVIGGVITNNTALTRRSTPWLGDLPIIGALFRRDADTEERRTLYFFVTPHVLADKDFADLSEYSYGIKMKAADVIGADKLRLVDPDFSAGNDGDELQAFDIPLYRTTRGGEASMQDIGITPGERDALLEGESANSANGSKD